MYIFEYALDAGKHLLNDQTNWIHWHVERGTGGQACVTIPILENFLYTLALFRTNSIDRVWEARGRLERLLAFHVRGNFPIYLHEYPNCQDPLQGIKVASVLYFLLKHQGVHLGKILNDVTKKVLQQCISRVSQEERLPSWAQQRLCILTSQEESVCLQARWPLELDYLLVNEILAGKSLDPFLQYWNTGLSCHSYPLLRRYQFGVTSMVQFYDLFCATWIEGSIPPRLQLYHAAHLHLAFVPEKVDSSTTLSLGHCKEVQHVYVADSEIPFTLFFGEKEDLNSLVLAAKHLTVGMCTQGKNKFLLDICLAKEIPNQGEGGLEVNFFVNKGKDNHISVNGVKASVFSLDDEIAIHSKKRVIQLQFLSPPKGLVGHIYPGNRPSQLASTGEKHFHAFDTLIGLRSFKRKTQCALSVQITCYSLQDFLEKGGGLPGG